MNKLKLTMAGLILGTAAFAAPVSASPITIDFGANGDGFLVNPDGDDNRFFWDQNIKSGVSLRITGWKDVDINGSTTGIDISASFNDQENVTRDTSGSQQGLGVDGERDDIGSQVDGEDGSEALLFELSESLWLTEIWFNNVDGNDDFAFVLDGILMMVDVDIPNSGLFVFDTPVFVQNWFAIGADTGGQFEENFKVRGITVVPEPAAIGLLGLGLLGLGVARRRRKSA